MPGLTASGDAAPMFIPGAVAIEVIGNPGFSNIFHAWFSGTWETQNGVPVRPTGDSVIIVQDEAGWEIEIVDGDCYHPTFIGDSAPSLNAMACPAPGITEVRIDGRDMNDEVTAVVGTGSVTGQDITLYEHFVGVGGTENDVVNAGPGGLNGELGSYIDGYRGNDILNGSARNDTIVGYTGGDTISGGGGWDTISYAGRGSGVAVTVGDGQANDGEQGERDNVVDIEEITGSDYADELYGDAGPNRLNGGWGDDYLNGGPGADILDGGAGTDKADYSWYSGVTVSLNDIADDTEGDNVLSSVENVWGSIGDDWIWGSGASNRLVGSGGTDHLYGGGGDDRLWGDDASGAPFSGTPARDLLWGEGGLDELHGGPGFDDLAGGSNGDDLHADADGANMWGEAGSDNLYGSNWTDYLYGGPDNDDLWGEGSYDELFGEAGNDDLDGGSGGDYLDGGNDNDTISYEGRMQAVYLTPGNGVADDGQCSLFCDYVEEGDNIAPVYGVDTFEGTDYADRFWGDGGSSVFWSNGGDDRFFGGLGADTFVGGGGIDTASYSDKPDSADVTVALNGLADDGTTGEGDNISADVENIEGHNGRDFIVGSSSNNTILAYAGDDRVVGNGGADIIDGGFGNDTLWGGDTDEVGTLLGAGDKDELYAGIGNDRLFGEDGADLLFGDYGNDYLDGGRIDGAVDTLDARDGIYLQSYGYVPDTLFSDTVLCDHSTLGRDWDAAHTDANDATRDCLPPYWLVCIGFMCSYPMQTQAYAPENIDEVIESIADVFIDRDENLEQILRDLMGWYAGELTKQQVNALIERISRRSIQVVAKVIRGVLKIEIRLANPVDPGPGCTQGPARNIVHCTATKPLRIVTGNAGDEVTVAAGVGVNATTGGGNDTVAVVQSSNSGIVPRAANTVVDLGPGDDVATLGDTGAGYNVSALGGDGNDRLAVGAGTMALDGGAGRNTIDYSTHSTPVTVVLPEPGSESTGNGSGGADTQTLRNFDDAVGSNAGSTLVGNSNVNILFGGTGNDWLNGRGALDWIIDVGGWNGVTYRDHTAGVRVVLPSNGGYTLNNGAPGEGDVLWGRFVGLEGGQGTDYLEGNTDANVLYDSHQGPDTLSGVAGACCDWVSYAWRAAGITVVLPEPGASATTNDGDTLWGIDNVEGSRFDDLLYGNSRGNQLRGGAGNDTLLGRGGTDWADYWTHTAPVTVALGETAAGTGGSAGETDTIAADIDNVGGGQTIDIITGNSRPNQLAGRGGNDVITGNGGPDTIWGESGSDYLYGDAGPFSQLADNGIYLLTAGTYGGNTVFGGSNDDQIDVANGTTDTVYCEGGFDTVFYDESEYATDSFADVGACERGQRVGWGKWQRHGVWVDTLAGVATASPQQGVTDVFYRAVNSGAIERRRRTANGWDTAAQRNLLLPPGSNWSSPKVVDATVTANGTEYVTALAGPCFLLCDNTVYLQSISATGVQSGWQSLGRPPAANGGLSGVTDTASAAVAPIGTMGEVAVFVRGDDRRLWANVKLFYGLSSFWTGWIPFSFNTPNFMPVKNGSSPTATLTSDGFVNVTAFDYDGRPFSTSFSCQPSSTGGAPTCLWREDRPPSYTTPPCPPRPDGTCDVWPTRPQLARTSAGRYTRFVVNANATDVLEKPTYGPWSKVAPLRQPAGDPPQWAEWPAVSSNRYATMQLFVSDPDGFLHEINFDPRPPS